MMVSRNDAKQSATFRVGSIELQKSGSVNMAAHKHAHATFNADRALPHVTVLHTHSSHVKPIDQCLCCTHMLVTS